MAKDQICNYASCMETCERGVVVTLREPDREDGSRAAFCCASHAAAALRRLAKDRSELFADVPQFWKHR
jgi:hypothetical protein